MPDDYYVSQYSGEEIDALLGGAGEGTVRYDAAQTLTDAQKAQARGNINAAPSGFGYGENQIFQKLDDNDGSQFEAFVDQMIDGTIKIVRLTQVADYPANIVSGNGGFADIKIDSNGSALVLFHGPVNVLEGSIDGVYHASKKRLLNGTWLPWEYDNPPLALGVEYRTTERYLGKSVYVKQVSCGTLSDGKEVEHGISNMDYCISAQGLMSGMALPKIINHDLSSTWSVYISQVTKTKIRFECGTSVVGNNIAAVLKYTKTTN